MVVLNLGEYVNQLRQELDIDLTDNSVSAEQYLQIVKILNNVILNLNEDNDEYKLNELISSVDSLIKDIYNKDSISIKCAIVVIYGKMCRLKREIDLPSFTICDMNTNLFNDIMTMFDYKLFDSLLVSDNDEAANHYKFIQNTKCEYFPCHKNIPIDKFNCLFCYCPLYSDCKAKLNDNDILFKDCSNCEFPHIKDNYDKVICKLNSK